VACVPQRFPDEDVSPLMEAAARCLPELVRDGDVTGVLGDDVLLVGLPDANAAEARAFSSRLQSELTMRSRHLRNTIWDPGVASLGADGATADELLAAAIDAARQRRRRLAR
jgi:GGDEF domain-containing protein